MNNCYVFACVCVVCYFPDYDLIQEAYYEGQPLNSSGYSAGFYIDSSNPSRCSGLGVMIEACAEQRNISNNTDVYRMFFTLYTHERNLYKQTGRTATFTSRSLTTTFGCDIIGLNKNTGWIVKPGDVIGVEILSECNIFQQTMSACPAHGVFDPSGIRPNNTVQYSSSQPDLLSRPIHNFPTRPGFVNVRALVGRSI